MKISISAGEICAGYSPEALFNAYQDSGFRHFEWNLGSYFPRKEYSEADVWKKVDEAEAATKKRGFDLLSAHAPYHYNPCINEENFQLQVRDSLLAIRACGKLGVDRLVVHAGYGFSENYDEMLKKNVRYYAALLPEAEKQNVSLLIENISEEVYKQKLVIEYADNILELRRRLGDHPLIGACWDTGHANTKRMDQYPEIVKLEGILKGTHIQDNNGINDDHMAPLTGCVDFDEVLSALVKINYDGPFNLETSIFKYGDTWPNYRGRQTKEIHSDHRIFSPDDALSRYSAGVMYHIAAYMLEKYELEIE